MKKIFLGLMILGFSSVNAQNNMQTNLDSLVTAITPTLHTPPQGGLLSGCKWQSNHGQGQENK